MEKKNKTNELMFDSLECDGFFEALELQYGETVPLYHATDESSYESIKIEGLKLMEGKNNLLWGRSSQLYFQIGCSDYLDDFRCVLLKYDAPINWLAKFAYADPGNVKVTDEDLLKYGVCLDKITSEMKDFLEYYIWNDFKIEGMEIIIKDPDLEGIGEIFPQRIH